MRKFFHNIYYKYYAVSDDNPLTETSFLGRITVYITGIVICLFCIAYSSYAFFSANNYKEPSLTLPDISFQVTDSDGNYILLHTNSAYPSPVEELNLRMITTLRERYHCIVGYSGHEIDLEPTVIATSLGAKVIERHVTLDHNMWGTDQAASLSVSAMAMLHGRMKDVLTMLGSGEKVITEKEMAIINDKRNKEKKK